MEFLEFEWGGIELHLSAWVYLTEKNSSARGDIFY